MKKDILEKLAKETLYPLYQALKLDIPEKILKEIQFLDELPSKKLWEHYISQSQSPITVFADNLMVSNYFYFETTDESKEKLSTILEKDELYLLFANQNNAILFSQNNLFAILDSLDFFNDEDLLLYGMDSQSIITGGSGGMGFTTWVDDLEENGSSSDY